MNIQSNGLFNLSTSIIR